MPVEAVQDPPSAAVTAVPTGPPTLRLDPQIAQVVATVDNVAKTVGALANLGGKGGGYGAVLVLAIVAAILGIINMGTNIAHLTMGDRAMDDRLDRIELVLTIVAQEIAPEVAPFIEKK